MGIGMSSHLLIVAPTMFHSAYSVIFFYFLIAKSLGAETVCNDGYCSTPVCGTQSADIGACKGGGNLLTEPCTTGAKMLTKQIEADCEANGCNSEMFEKELKALAKEIQELLSTHMALKEKHVKRQLKEDLEDSAEEEENNSKEDEEEAPAKDGNDDEDEKDDEEETEKDEGKNEGNQTEKKSTNTNENIEDLGLSQINNAAINDKKKEEEDLEASSADNSSAEKEENDPNETDDEDDDKDEKENKDRETPKVDDKKDEVLGQLKMIELGKKVCDVLANQEASSLNEVDEGETQGNAYRIGVSTYDPWVYQKINYLNQLYQNQMAQQSKK